MSGVTSFLSLAGDRGFIETSSEALTVFLFFSNRLGCGLSLLISVVVSLVLFVACGGPHVLGH